MKRGKRIIDHVVHGMDLDMEAIPGRPFVEIVEDCRVIVENHYGISVYQNERIYVAVNYGEIQVTGDRLSVVQMTKSRIVIAGVIHCVQLCKRGHT